MDPVTHALLGAAFAQALFPVPEKRRALLLGAMAGTLADADVFLRFVSDPALPWEVHRHATHSLAAAPLGGFVAALPFLLFGRLSRPWRRRWKRTWAAAALAYATHGLLDACTSYGTHLLLPFSAQRSAWDIISIVDPIFTAILLVGVLWTAWRTRPRATAVVQAPPGSAARATFVAAPALVALLACGGYLGLGARQHAAAMHEIARLAAARGQTVAHARAIPTPGTLVLWRGLYVAESRIYVDGGRVPILGVPRWREGSSVPLFSPNDLPRSVADDPGVSERQARIADVVARFERFTDGFVARDPEHPDILADMRYSLAVDAFSPLWGIRLNAASDGDPVSWVDLIADRRASLRLLWRDLRRN